MIRKDIEEMEKEKDIVNKRIERMQRKVEGMPNMEVMLQVTLSKLQIKRILIHLPYLPLAKPLYDRKILKMLIFHHKNDIKNAEMKP